MKKTIPLLFFIFIFLSKIIAQPLCLPNFGGIPAGNDAPGCTLCSPIYHGSTEGYSPTAPGSNGFPCGSIENNQFITIAADSSGNLSATILASNCQNNQGVQLIIYDTNFNPVSNCFSSGGINIPGNVMVTGLIPGQLYWLMIDGFAGDICDIRLTISGGIYSGPPDPPGPMTITPDTILCPGAIACYEIDPVEKATFYDWNIPSNGIIVSGGTPADNFVCVEYFSPGGGAVRVTPSNHCFPGIPEISPVIVLPILPTLKPPEFICVSDFPIVRDGNAFNNSGSHEITYLTDLGCDSIVTYIFLPKTQIPNVIDTLLCPGDCIQVGFTIYDSPTSETIELGPPFAQSNGCDSVVILNLNYFDPIASINPPNQISCDPNSFVNLNGTSSSLGTDISYSWRAENGGTIIGSPSSNFTQAGSPGRYILDVTQTAFGGFSCTASDTVDVVSANVPDELIFTAGETSVCPGSTHTFSFADTSNPLGYVWMIPQDASITGGDPSSTSVEITFGNKSGFVCISQRGDCGNSVPACMPVKVISFDDPAIIAPSNICIEDRATINYYGKAPNSTTFQWDFDGGMPSSVTGKGPHFIRWSTSGTKNISLSLIENGCSSTAATQTIEIEEFLQEPVINCTSTDSTIRFSWDSIPGVIDYNVFTNLTLPTNQVETNYELTHLTSGEVVSITVTTNSDGICPERTSTKNCAAGRCPDVFLNVQPIPDICIDNNTVPINLNADPTGGLGGGTFIWSGPGVSGNSFDPTAANTGMNSIILEYMEGSCVYTESFSVMVNTTPEPDFLVSTPICSNELAEVIYTGNAANNADYDWNFGNGNIVSGSGQGPFLIDYSGQSGVHSVALEVVENGCVSPRKIEIINIDAPLPAPNVYCGTNTSNSVEILWDEVPGATFYSVNPPIGVIGHNPRSLTVSGLDRGDEITVEIIAEGNNACGPSSSFITCQAFDCPPNFVDINPIGPFCADGTASPVLLTATTSGTNSGSFTWTGPGVSGFFFDPGAPGITPGIVTIRCEYKEGNCSYTASYGIDILTKPNSSFSAESPICIDEVSTIQFTQTVNTNTDLTWDFGLNSNIQSGAGVLNDPFEISWTEPGIQNISLIVVENGCQSDETVVQVQIDEYLTAPVIQCSSDISNISFNWTPVSGAIDYHAEVISTNVQGLPTNQTTPFSWDFSGLSPNDFIELEVTVSGATDCGPVQTNMRCTTQDCPDYNVVMPILSACSGSSVSGIDLLPLTTILNLSNESLKDSVGLHWSGTPGTDTYISPSGIFSPAEAIRIFGTGDVPISLEIEYPRNSGCFRSYSSSINIEALPINRIAAPDNICNADTVIVTLDNTPNSGADFDWDFGNAFVISGSGIGPYKLIWDPVFYGTTDTLAVEITENGCSAVFSHSITLSNLEFTAEIEQPIWFPGAPTDIDLSISNGTPNYDILWSTGETTEDLTGLSPGSAYCVSVTDQVGCTGTECFTISNGIYRINPAVVICSGQSTTLSVRPGRGADFEWFPLSDLSCTDCPNPTATPSESTLYEVKATLPNGRFSSQKVFVIVLPAFLCNRAKSTDDILKIVEESGLDLQKLSENDLLFLEKEITNYLSIQNIKVLPNPTEGKVEISSFEDIENVEVFDFSGRKVKSEAKNHLDLSELPSGVYYFKIKTRSQTAIKKVFLL